MTRDNPYEIGDPVVDLAQGRPMIVLDAPAQTVADMAGERAFEGAFDAVEELVAESPLLEADG